MEWRKGGEEDQGNIQRSQVDLQLQRDQEDDLKVAKTKALPREKPQLQQNETTRRESLRKRTWKNRHLRTHLRTKMTMTKRSSNYLTTALPHNQPNKLPADLQPVNNRECHSLSAITKDRFNCKGNIVHNT